jgi:hypothetical protein
MTGKLTLASLAIAAAILAAPSEPSKEFSGVITDTMCGAKSHSSMMKDKTDAECVRICTRGSYAYALLSEGSVMKLSDQKASEKYAGRKVRVTGRYDEKNKTLRVVSIAPENGSVQ